MPTKLTITYGKELFSPKAYNTFEIGPFTAEVEVGPDESVEEVFQREYSKLKTLAQSTFASKRGTFMLGLEAVGGNRR